MDAEFACKTRALPDLLPETPSGFVFQRKPMQRPTSVLGVVSAQRILVIVLIVGNDVEFIQDCLTPYTMACEVRKNTSDFRDRRKAPGRR